MLDGVGAGIFGALTPLVLADLMRGTGRYNMAQGAVATVQGIGASTSGLVAGEIVDHFGYSAAFLTSGAAAVISGTTGPSPFTYCAVSTTGTCNTRAESRAVMTIVVAGCTVPLAPIVTWRVRTVAGSTSTGSGR